MHGPGRGPHHGGVRLPSRRLGAGIAAAEVLVMAGLGLASVVLVSGTSPGVRIVGAALIAALLALGGSAVKDELKKLEIDIREEVSG